MLRPAAALLAILVALGVADGVVRGPQWFWNDIRLARGVGLRYGYPLYAPREAFGPIVGTMHLPVSHLLNFPLSVVHDPTAALMAACALSAALLLAAILWVHRRAAGKARLAAAYGFLACAAIALTSPGIRFALLNVHVDAPALCCAVLAAGLAAFTDGRRALGASAVLSVLAIACKQTLAPAAIALAVFIVLQRGWRRAAFYVAVQACAAAALAGVLLWLCGPARGFIFNTWTLARRMPPSSLNGGTLHGVYELREQTLAAIPALVCLLALAAFGERGGLRARMASSPWAVFLLAAAFQLPMALRAWNTAGGSMNHIGAVALFATLAATVGATALWASPDAHAGLLGRVLLAGIVLAKIYVPWQLPEAVAALPANPTAVAWRYEREHPGRAYFPLNPLAALLASGRLTHADPAVFDREQCGFPLTPEQFRAGLPPGVELVAYSPRQGSPTSAQLQRLIAGAQPVSEPGLEGWVVYRIGGAGGDADHSGEFSTQPSERTKRLNANSLTAAIPQTNLSH